MHPNAGDHPAIPAGQLDEPRFTAGQCDALFAAILVDDEVDLDARLPEPMRVDCDQDTLVACYRLCRQVWLEGTNRVALAKIVNGICRHGTVGGPAQLTFKHVRARFKQLRFACAVYGAAHRYPRLFDLVTALMGSMQDAFKNGRPARTLALALPLRLMLSPIPWRLLRREIDTFEPATPESYGRYLDAEMDRASGFLARGETSAAAFHELRKIISRQSAIYSNLNVLAPIHGHAMLGRYINTLNGLMGQLHDEMIERHFRNARDDRADTFAIPATIRDRLAALVRWYGQA